MKNVIKRVTDREQEINQEIQVCWLQNYFSLMNYAAKYFSISAVGLTYLSNAMNVSLQRYEVSTNTITWYSYYSRHPYTGFEVLGKNCMTSEYSLCIFFSQFIYFAHLFKQKIILMIYINWNSKKGVFKVNKSVYIASRTYRFCWQYAIMLVWKT